MAIISNLSEITNSSVAFSSLQNFINTQKKQTIHDNDFQTIEETLHQHCLELERSCKPVILP